MSKNQKQQDKGPYPYIAQYGAIKQFPDQGIDSSVLLNQLSDMATAEDLFWQTGKCSGTMYGGDSEIFKLIGSAYKLYSHVNALQRDICPSQTKFEAEIIAMTLDMLNGDAVQLHNSDQKACGAVGLGGTDSIISALLSYRNKYRLEKQIVAPEAIIPVSAHPAFRKGAYYFGIKVIDAPLNPETTLVDVDFVRSHLNKNTIVIVGSAGNYPYGTVDPIEELSELAIEHQTGLHVDGCLGGFILPWGEQLGFDIPKFDFRLPGVTSISADTHKFGYGPKGSSVIAYRDASYRKYQYYTEPGWVGGMYISPGIGGSRSGGIIAATWAVMLSLGKEGYLQRAKRIFETAFQMQESVKKHPELKISGKPTFCFSFASDQFDIYHVNDYMSQKGWRFNGQQYPSGIHLCVTGPQTRPGIVETFDRDLAEAVGYAKNPPQEIPLSGALYGGQGSRALAENVDLEMVKELMIAYQDACLEQP